MKHSRHHLVRSLAAVCALLLGAAGNASAQTRDPVNPLDPNNPLNSPIWPFSRTSPWNMPIGSGAQYVPINLAVPNEPGNPPSIPPTNWAAMPANSDEYIVLAPTAPLTDINHSDAGWTGANRCHFTDTPPILLARVPIPAGYFVESSMGNNAAAFLMPDLRTIIQSNAFTRCATENGLATSIQSFNYADVYSDGRWGSHGATQLSAIGGSIHLGELRPGKPVRHAIALTVDTPVVLDRCLTINDCFRWPAYSADCWAAPDGPCAQPPTFYGSQNPNPVPGMKIGALLAISASTDINSLGLETEPGLMLAWTLQNYGAYIVESTGGPGINIDLDIGPTGSKQEEFDNDAWSNTPPFKAPGPFFQRVNDGDGTHGNAPFGWPWTRDVQKLWRALQLVANNGPDSIGGGGTPRQPLAPPLAKERFENDISAIVGNPDAAWVLHGPETANFSDGTAHSANTPTTATFAFTGTALSWIGIKCNTCGTANVSIDGGAATPVNTAGPAALGSVGLTSGVVYTTPTLAAGSHTVVITVPGGTDIFIDALDVTP